MGTLWLAQDYRRSAGRTGGGVHDGRRSRGHEDGGEKNKLMRVLDRKRQDGPCSGTLPEG